MTHSVDIQTELARDFRRARHHALFNAVLGALHLRRTDLLPFDEVRSRIYIREQSDRGIQSVPLAKIVGSQGRYADFDRSFLPLRGHTQDRWTSVNRAFYQDIWLPPVELFQIGDIYFVSDGNHRVSVARGRGQVDIDAHVIEFKTDVPLTADLDMRSLVYKEEQSDFLEWTSLAQLRPEGARAGAIEVSELGGYLDLIRHINRHRASLAAQYHREVEIAEVVTDWYDTVYQPLVTAIRSSRLLKSFPGRTETDLYIWIVDHREQLTGESGQDLRPTEKLLGFLADRGTLQARLRGMIPGGTWLGRPFRFLWGRIAGHDSR